MLLKNAGLDALQSKEKAAEVRRYLEQIEEVKNL
jgi:hypothetical protein